MRIAVTGASGLVGRALVPFLRAAGHEVSRLQRSPPQADYDVQWPSHDPQFRFDPGTRWDAVVHLAGEPVAEKRWSSEQKSRILSSRGDVTLHLVQALAALDVPPAVFVCASAVGYYGDGRETLLRESSPVGTGFLAEVCRDWEGAAATARGFGARVVSLRIGVVLTAEGGMLAQLVPIYRAGLGGPVGSGLQWLSWLHRDDLLALILLALTDARLSGPVNAVSPEPVRQGEFARQLARVLHRPAFLPTPAFAVRLAFGAMADEVLLAGQRVLPEVAQQAGFTWKYNDLADALRAELPPP